MFSIEVVFDSFNDFCDFDVIDFICGDMVLFLFCIFFEISLICIREMGLKIGMNIGVIFVNEIFGIGELEDIVVVEEVLSIGFFWIDLG